MSVIGFKKQISKTNQFVSEKIKGVKGTQFDDDFTNMQKKTDVLAKLFKQLVGKNLELLYPNPAFQAKRAASKNFIKMRGITKEAHYPQPEGLLGKSMSKYGKLLGKDSVFGEALVDSGEIYTQLGKFKNILENDVQHKFIKPLQHFQNNHLQAINYIRKKLEGRRLDYDNKKRRHESKENLADEKDYVFNAKDKKQMAAVFDTKDKVEEAKELAAEIMHNLIENEAEYVSLLSALIETEIDYHQHSLDSLLFLSGKLTHHSTKVSSEPRKEFIFDRSKILRSTTSSSKSVSFLDPRLCLAIYDSNPGEDGQLGFSKGDIIKIIGQIDENLLEGSLNGKSGFFPIDYVRVLNPL